MPRAANTATPVTAARTVSVYQRRSLLGARHRLTSRHSAPNAAGVANSIIALHASDPATVFLSVQARVPSATPQSIERELYEDRTVIRMLAMRRTVFVVPTVDAPIFQGATTLAIAAKERKLLVKLIEDGGVAEHGARWLARVEQDTRNALRARGEATAAELSEDVPALRTQVSVNEGKAYAGKIGLSTRVLFLLAADGVVTRGRPRGSWTSSLWHWAPADTWASSAATTASTASTASTAAPDPVAPERARVALARRWLQAFGPATIDDLRWWTGWTLRDTRAALASLPVIEVVLEGTGDGIALADDAELADSIAIASANEPWVALLPALDPTPMGWTKRDWYLGEHRARLFDYSGNIGPTVWCDGRVVGGWAQRKDGEVRTSIFEDIGADRASMVAASAERLAAWLGDVRVSPRFPTPVDRELQK